TEVVGHKLSDDLMSLADFEGVLWLHYGFELGIFSGQEADFAFCWYGERLLKSLERVGQLNSSRFFPSEIQIFLDQTLRHFAVSPVNYADKLSTRTFNPEVPAMMFREVARFYR